MGRNIKQGELWALIPSNIVNIIYPHIVQFIPFGFLGIKSWDGCFKNFFAVLELVRSFTFLYNCLQKGHCCDILTLIYTFKSAPYQRDLMAVTDLSKRKIQPHMDHLLNTDSLLKSRQKDV